MTAPAPAPRPMQFEDFLNIYINDQVEKIEDKELFDPGKVVVTSNLQHILDESMDRNVWQVEVLMMMDRHLSGDWGVMDDEDKARNDQALENGGRICSAYLASNGVKVGFVTEGDRSDTIVMMAG